MFTKQDDEIVLLENQKRYDCDNTELLLLGYKGCIIPLTMLTIICAVLFIFLYRKWGLTI